MTSGQWSNPVGARQLRAKIPCRRAPLDAGKFSNELTFEHSHADPSDFSGVGAGFLWANKTREGGGE